MSTPAVLERRGDLAHGLGRLLAERVGRPRSAARAAGTGRRPPRRPRRARGRAPRSGRSPPSPRSRGARRAGCASRAPPRAPRAGAPRRRERASARWRSGSAGRGRRVARHDDELDALPLEMARRSRARTAHLGERAGPVREPRVVAEVDDVLVRQRDEQLVEDGEAAHAGVEHADRPAVHRADDTGEPSTGRSQPWATLRRRVGPRQTRAARPARGRRGAARVRRRRRASRRQDVTIASADGTPLAATLTVPDGAAPRAAGPR